MNRKLTAFLSLFLCVLLFAACTGESEQTDVPSVPGGTVSGETSGESADTAGEAEPSIDYSLSAEALAEYADWFAAMECNGLLRFPYENGADREQIAPYLEFVFYDIGETDLSDEERNALRAAGMFMELDEFRLSRAFVTGYLATYLDMPAGETEAMLSENEDLLGIYLPETDAWYICHSDTAWMSYTFEQGVSIHESEMVQLYYTNPFLTVVREDGEVDFLTDQPMVVTLSVEGGERKVISNEILSAPYN